MADLEEDIDEPESWQAFDREVVEGSEGVPKETQTEPDIAARSTDNYIKPEVVDPYHGSYNDDHDPEMDRTTDTLEGVRLTDPTTIASKSSTTISLHRLPTIIATRSARENARPSHNSSPTVVSPPQTRHTTPGSAHQIDMPIRPTRTSDFFPPGWQYTGPSTDDGHEPSNVEPTTPVRQHAPPKISNFPSRSPPDAAVTEGPLTPRNNAGPFVFDGTVNAV